MFPSLACSRSLSFSGLPASRLRQSILCVGCLADPGSASTKNSNPDADTQLHPVQLVLPFSISCLNEARKGSRSDLRNRIFRPITRRWGICFRSTQRYTVCGLTPRYLAASLTVSGSSLATIAVVGVSAKHEWFMAVVPSVSTLSRPTFGVPRDALLLIYLPPMHSALLHQFSTQQGDRSVICSSI